MTTRNKGVDGNNVRKYNMDMPLSELFNPTKKIIENTKEYSSESDVFIADIDSDNEDEIVYDIQNQPEPSEDQMYKKNETENISKPDDFKPVSKIITLFSDTDSEDDESFVAKDNEVILVDKSLKVACLNDLEKNNNLTLNKIDDNTMIEKKDTGNITELEPKNNDVNVVDKDLNDPETSQGLNVNEIDENSINHSINKNVTETNIINSDNVKGDNDSEQDKDSMIKNHGTLQVPILGDLSENISIQDYLNTDYTGITAMIMRRPTGQAEFDYALNQTHLKNRTFIEGTNTPVLAKSPQDNRRKTTIKCNWSISQITRKFRLFRSNVPGDGNCALTSTIAYINECKDRNYSVHDITISKFRKWFVFNYMRIMMDPSIYEWTDYSMRRSHSLTFDLKEPFTNWYNKKLETRYYTLEEGEDFIDPIYWFTITSFFPFVAMLIKKSILIYDRPLLPNGKYDTKGIISYLHYDDRYPNMFPCFEVYNYMTGTNTKEFNIDLDNTLFIEYEHQMHFNALVRERITPKKIRESKLPHLSSYPITDLNHEDEYHVNDNEYNSMVDDYKKFLNPFLRLMNSRPRMRRNKLHNDKKKSK